MEIVYTAVYAGKRKRKTVEDFHITFESLQPLLGYIIIPAFATRCLQKRVHLWVEKYCFSIKPLTPELNPSAQRCLPRFLMRILIFKALTARRLYKSFGVKGLIIMETEKHVRSVS
jgi:hypothetical protein